MLRELSLKNYLLLENFTLSFHPGFNLITGETGSGKSVLLEGLRILLGETVTKEDLSDAENKAYFELIYEDKEELITLTREVFPSGRSVSRINGEIANLNQVRELMAPKIDFYGQGDHSRLLLPSYQQSLLLSYDKERTAPLLERIRGYKEEEKRLKDELSQLKDLSPLEKEALEAQEKELQSLKLNLEQDMELEENFDELLHSREILENLSSSQKILESSVLSGLYELEDSLMKLQEFKRYENHHQRAKDLRYELEALLEELSEQLYNIDIDESYLAQQEARYSELRRMKRKYQRELPELQAYQEEISLQLERSKGLHAERQRIADERLKNRDAYLKTSHELLEIQKKSFKSLKAELQKILKGLELPDADFALEIGEREDEKFFDYGHYTISFLASMNRGPLRPMSHVLSGGEMSRLMLAIKVVFSQEEQGTMVFDEIDTGISGKVAHEVGKTIGELSKKQQIIAISHLPQVVAFSDSHFYLEKEKGTSRVRKLDEDEHVEVLATMMSAQKTQASLETAKAMIERAKGGNQ